MIHKATIEDLDNVDFHTLLSFFYIEAKQVGEYIPAIAKETWTRILSNKQGVIFLKWDNTKIVGAFGALLHPDPYDGKLVAQEMFWFVLPSARGSINAVRLFEAFEKWAKEQKVVRLTVGCLCNQSMATVRKFYEKRNFKPIEVGYIKVL